MTAVSASIGFGSLLREWREHRRMSQLALSTEADISQRHISYLETGRARPSTVTIARLSDALALPLRERNVLLRAAGFSERYPEESLDAAGTTAFRAAIEAMLTHHEPWPAMVVDGRWNLVDANPAAFRLFGLFVDLSNAIAAIGAPTDYQLARLCLHDDGLRPFIANWEEVVEAFLRRARLALAANPRDSAVQRFIAEVVDHPDAPGAWRAPDRSVPAQPVITLDLRKGSDTLRLFTMLAHFGNPQSVTLQELAVELFFPADESTGMKLRELAAATPLSRPDG